MGGIRGDSTELTLDDAVSSAAVLRVYGQVFSVLADQSQAMISDPALLDVDEAILEAFAEAGAEGLTVEQLHHACGRVPGSVLDRRFEVLRSYGAISRIVDRPYERRHRAAFAPYVTVLFLRRMAEQGGQAELHRYLTLEHLGLQSEAAGPADGAAALARLTRVFRLLANELSTIAIGGAIEQLRESAQLLWSNRELIDQATNAHQVALARWPQLGRDCAALRMAVAAYADAIDGAAERLIDRAGTTRALGLLPVEVWRSFVRLGDVDQLAVVLDGFLFDAPAPWFDPLEMEEAVSSGRRDGAVGLPPPRPGTETASIPSPVAEEDEARLRDVAEWALAGRDVAGVVETLEVAGDWYSARRVLADLTAAHQHPGLPYELIWREGLRVEPGRFLSWVSAGQFRRTAGSRGSA